MTDEYRQKIESNIGKKVRLWPHTEINEYWFIPWTNKRFLDGTVTRVYWQLGDTPFYIVDFGGYEGAFKVSKNYLKFL